MNAVELAAFSMCADLPNILSLTVLQVPTVPPFPPHPSLTFLNWPASGLLEENSSGWFTAAQTMQMHFLF